MQQISRRALGERLDARRVGLIFDHRQCFFERAETAAVVRAEDDVLFADRVEQESQRAREN